MSTTAVEKIKRDGNPSTRKAQMVAENENNQKGKKERENVFWLTFIRGS